MSQVALSKTRVLGAVLLIAGSCIGAGMLALPSVTGPSGFFPALSAILFSWAFMTTTALLLLEINLWLGPQVSIVTMSRRTLGKPGALLAWVLFCYLFYLILLAYSSGSGSLYAGFVEGMTGVPGNPRVGSTLFAIFFAFLIYLGTQTVDYVNRVLMVGLIISYLFLIALGAPQVRTDLFRYANWGVAGLAVPIVILSFGFHNMLPSLTRYLGGNRKGMLIAVLVGGLIPLVVYLLFDYIILGIVPVDHFAQASDDLVTSALRLAVGTSWINPALESFGFFALVTSIVAQALSLFHFIADGLSMRTDRPRNRIFLILLVFLPPLIATYTNPTLFLVALGLAGTYGAVTLFGIMPALMVWVARYREAAIVKPILPGGRFSLVVVIFLSLLIIVTQFLDQLGVW